MKIYRSNIWDAFGYRLTRHLMLGQFFMIWFFSLGIKVVVISILVYMVVAYFYLGLTNNNFTFKDENVEIRSSVFHFQKAKKIRYDRIKKVIMKHEPTKPDSWISVLLFFIIPIEYKWIEIKTSKENFTFYCFGLEYDCWESQGETTMEDVFFEFAKRNVSVKWTKSRNGYYNDMNKRANKILNQK